MSPIFDFSSSLLNFFKLRISYIYMMCLIKFTPESFLLYLLLTSCAACFSLQSWLMLLVPAWVCCHPTWGRIAEENWCSSCPTRICQLNTLSALYSSPLSILEWRLLWSHAGLIQAITASVSSYVQRACHVWPTSILHWFMTSAIYSLSSPFLKWPWALVEGWGEIQMSHLLLGTPLSLILCALTSCGSVY